MVFVPPDRLLWDFWLAPRQAGEPYHLFFLQAPRDLPDPELRHGLATVGHAVSDDLVHWRARPTALTAGAPGAWDDRAVWTGSIVAHNNTHYWFYTGVGRRDWTQRIGLATSSDPGLECWHRHPANPLIAADPRWYEQHDPRLWPDETCRDPWVAADPAGDGWHLFFTVRANHGPADCRGVVGHARSWDLTAWEQRPSVTAPGEFGFLEVPQTLRIGWRWYLLFCTDKHGAARRQRCSPGADWHGTHYLVADRLDGPYRLLTDEALVGDAPGTYYAGRAVEDPTGRLVFLAWRRWDDAGRFLGGLSDPAPITVLPDGRLHVDAAALWPER